MLLGFGLYSQEATLNRAQQLFRAQKYEQAALAVDSAVAHPQTTRDFVSWTTRAYSYYYIYVKTDKAKLESRLRDTVLISVRKSIALNPDSDYVANNKKILVNLAAHYFNISRSLLQDSLNYERSQKAYNRYKELTKLQDASLNSDSKDVEYYLAVGSVYSEIFNKDNKNLKAQQIAKVALMKVLDIEPENPGANMNMGLLYFNQAVNIVKEMDGEIPIEKIDEVQTNVEKLARQSEKYIYRVYKNDNKNRKACTALCYIYRMLYQLPKSDEFKKKAEDLGEKFESAPSDNKNDK
jgi:tetratricopeptide (TPR) repeat protein